MTVTPIDPFALTLRYGSGALEPYTSRTERRAMPMASSTVAYVPPRWAHRSVNTGDEAFMFFAVYPGQAGHDYATIERTGFRQRVLRGREGPVLR
jgi:glucose-6-phosphate isomerase, archaeal